MVLSMASIDDESNTKLGQCIVRCAECGEGLDFAEPIRPFQLGDPWVLGKSAIDFAGTNDIGVVLSVRTSGRPTAC